MEKEKISFEKLWEEKLAPALESLEGEKKKAKKYIFGWVMFALTILFGPIFIAFVWFSYEESTLPTLLATLFTILVAVYIFRVIKRNKNNYKESYKEKIFDVLLNSARFDWEFLHYTGDDKKRMGNIESTFKMSSLYGGYDNFHDDEVIVSRHREASIIVSEVYVTKTVRTEKSSHEVIVFQGFFIEIKTDKNFEGETYVMTEKDGSYMKGGHPMNISRSTVKETELEWNDFEKFLKVMSTHPREAREIFTPDFMETIYHWWTDHKKDLRFAFKGESVYITTPSHVQFEASVFGSLDGHKDSMREHLELLWFIEDITDMLLSNSSLKIN